MGDRIFFAHGAWAPGTDTGDALLAHELTHVVQFQEGRVPAAVPGELRVSEPGDALEREAEAAEQAGVVDLVPETAAQAGSEPASAEPTPAVHRHSPHRKRPGQVIAELPDSGGEPLEEAQRQRFEQAFDHDFRHVRIHRDPEAARAAATIGAHAFTAGADVFFGRDEYAPDTPAGDRLLAHELTHAATGVRPQSLTDLTGFRTGGLTPDPRILTLELRLGDQG